MKNTILFLVLVVALSACSMRSSTAVSDQMQTQAVNTHHSFTQQAIQTNIMMGARGY